jgi:co-chaperonin GroES (HSP10)
MNILPLPGQCLVEILPSADSIGGIVIPKSVEIKDANGKLPCLRARVHRLGRWPQKKGGRCVLPEFSPGDKVIVSQYSGHKLKRLDDRFRLVRIADVLAVLT